MRREDAYRKRFFFFFQFRLLPATCDAKFYEGFSGARFDKRTSTHISRPARFIFSIVDTLVKRHRVARARFRTHSSGYVALLHYGSSLVKYTRRGVRIDDNVTFGYLRA